MLSSEIEYVSTWFIVIILIPTPLKQLIVLSLSFCSAEYTETKSHKICLILYSQYNYAV